VSCCFPCKKKKKRYKDRYSPALYKEACLIKEMRDQGTAVYVIDPAKHKPAEIRVNIMDNETTMGSFESWWNFAKKDPSVTIQTHLLSPLSKIPSFQGTVEKNPSYTKGDNCRAQKHRLKIKGNGNPWYCSGRKEFLSGCQSGLSQRLSTDARYKCDQCDYDLCEECHTAIGVYG
jgi:hypothetical protein